MLLECSLGRRSLVSCVCLVLLLTLMLNLHLQLAMLSVNMLTWLVCLICGGGGQVACDPWSVHEHGDLKGRVCQLFLYQVHTRVMAWLNDEPSDWNQSRLRQTLCT